MKKLIFLITFISYVSANDHLGKLLTDYIRIIYKQIRFLFLFYQACPKEWVEFKGTVSCYRFQRYPLMNVEDARVRCQNDGATLLSVESLSEHMFIKDWLRKNDIEQREWYTSGQDLGERWTWTSLNAVFSFELGFLPDTPYDQGSNLVYKYRMGEWGWVRSLGSTPFPFICEIPIQESYKIVSDKRKYSWL